MVNWRAIRDLFPRKFDSLSDWKRHAWAPKPGDGIRPPRKIDDVEQRAQWRREVANAMEIAMQPMLMHGPQFDESGDWKRH